MHSLNHSHNTHTLSLSHSLTLTHTLTPHARSLNVLLKSRFECTHNTRLKTILTAAHTLRQSVTSADKWQKQSLDHKVSLSPSFIQLKESSIFFLTVAQLQPCNQVRVNYEMKKVVHFLFARKLSTEPKKNVTIGKVDLLFYTNIIT